MAQTDLRFCPRCAGALEWRPAGDARADHPVCTACGFILWQNPKPSVEALIVRRQDTRPEVLLGRLAAGPAGGLWDIPGGFLNAGDRLHEALIRECRREMDVEIRIGELLGAFEDTFFGTPIITLVYLCELASGVPRAADIVDEVAWFPLVETPPLAYTSIGAAVAALRQRLDR